jgi:hypothetical protein
MVLEQKYTEKNTGSRFEIPSPVGELDEKFIRRAVEHVKKTLLRKKPETAYNTGIWLRLLQTSCIRKRYMK